MSILPTAILPKNILAVLKRAAPTAIQVCPQVIQAATRDVPTVLADLAYLDDLREEYDTLSSDGFRALEVAC